MDIATIIGLVGGVAAIIMSVITSGGSLMGIIDIPSVFMTIGGSFCAILIVSPMKDVLHTFKVLGKVFKIPDFGEKVLVQNMVALSEKARREGILILEDGLEDLEDPFMKSGLRLVIDGTDGAVVRTIMENEMSQIEARHLEWVNVINQWAGFAPGFGMMGTVLGLIGMLNNLEDKSSLGPNMAVALITTLYGSLLSNWIATPTANKMKADNDVEIMMKEVMIEGLLSIQAGENPRVIEEKLKSFLSPKQRDELSSEPANGGEA